MGLLKATQQKTETETIVVGAVCDNCGAELKSATPSTGWHWSNILDALWGRVKVHRNGVWRAQYAYPASFVFNSAQRPSRTNLEILADRYGVPVDPGDLAEKAMKIILEANPWKRV